MKQGDKVWVHGEEWVVLLASARGDWVVAENKRKIQCAFTKYQIDKIIENNADSGEQGGSYEQNSSKKE